MKRISVEQKLFDRINRLKRSDEETILSVVQRAIYHLESDEILWTTWDERLHMERPYIPAVREAMISGELTRDFDWFRKWQETRNQVHWRDRK